MTLEAWALFCPTETVLCLSPGPSAMVVISQSLTRGPSAGVRASGGVLAANAIYFSISASGLVALHAVSAEAFTAIRWAGAAYLAWLGARTIWRSFASADSPRASGAMPSGHPFWRGFVGQGANPNLLVYFSAILPQFVDPAAPIAPQVAILACSSFAIEFSVLSGYAHLSGRAGGAAGGGFRRSTRLTRTATLRWFLAVAMLSLTMVQPAAGRQDERAAVVLLHGIARTDRSMSALTERLSEAGFRTHNVRYPSTEQSPAELVEFLASEVAACCKDAPSLHFVTHSLGGLLVRAYLAGHKPGNLGRVVMIAPPNRGSEIVDSLGDTALFRWVYGPTGPELGTDEESFPNRLPDPDYEVGIIAGTESLNPIGSALIPDQDDGAVSVERTRLPGMADFVTVRRSHTFIMNAPETAEHTVHFLEHGRFAHAPAPPAKFRDEGACPFECCTYREWTVREVTDVHESPEPDSPYAFHLQKGESVTAVTGFVRTREPGRIEVLKQHSGEAGREYNAGDVLWVYTNLGEGLARVWFDEEMYSEDVHGRVEGLEGQAACASRGTCWAKWVREPQSVWWVKLQNAEGRIGWTDLPQHFANVDACE